MRYEYHISTLMEKRIRGEIRGGFLWKSDNVIYGKEANKHWNNFYSDHSPYLLFI